MQATDARITPRLGRRARAVEEMRSKATAVRPPSASRTLRHEASLSVGTARAVAPEPIRSAAQAGASGEWRQARKVFLIVESLVIADIKTARIAQRLKIPRLITALAQRRVNEMPLLLACEHRLMQLG